MRKQNNLLKKIEHMSAEEESVENIKKADMHYDREDDYLERTSTENSETGVE